LAALQGTEDAIVFGSGAGANAVTITALLNAGDHVICVRNCYSWTYRLLTEILNRYGVETSFIDGRKLEYFESAMKPNTRLVYLESPTSNVFDLQDLYVVSAWAKTHNIITMVDHSFTGPMNRVPVDAGIDLIMHTMSKYINGHSDVMGGLVCGNRDLINRIFSPTWMTYGAVLSPHDSWLTLRGLRTLDVRMKRSIHSTEKLISFLQEQKLVERVIHPMCTSHPQHRLALEQIGEHYPLFSVVFKDKRIDELDEFVNSLKLFKIAVSWGGFESLALSSIQDYHGEEMPIVRFYIGLESEQDLIEDLQRALFKW
jgi:cystathionine beta-lyase/cystathionine gamma-synthase